MKIGLSVQEFYTNKIDANLKKISLAAIKVKGQGVDLLCFGEAVLQGFNALNGDFKRDKHIAVSVNSKPILKLKEIAKKNSVALAAGYLEYAEGNIYSSYLIIDNKGDILHNYRRISIGWKEKSWGKEYKEGNGFKALTFCGKTLSAGLCGDFWFNDSLLPIDADIVLWPIYVDGGLKLDSEYAKQAGKIGRCVLLVNSILNEDSKAEGGAICFMGGKIQSELAVNTTGTLVCVL